MPTYEYLCKNKGHQFEVFQKITDAPVTECQVCKGPVEKLVSATNFHLKGGGWYVTDYKKSGSSASAPASPPTAASSAVNTTKSECEKTGGGAKEVTPSSGGKTDV